MDGSSAKPGAKREAWIMLAAAAATAFMILLVLLAYNSAEAARKALVLQAQRETEKRALSLEHFFTERRDNVVELARSRELSVYFENKALGMSMEYGLRQSLPPIREKFDYFLESKKIGSSPIFTRFALIEPDGSILVDTSSAKSPSQEKAPAYLLNPSLKQGEIIAGEHEKAIMASAAYYFKGSYAGQLVAWLDGDCLGKHLLSEGNAREGGGDAALLLKSSLETAIGRGEGSLLNLPSREKIRKGGAFEYLPKQGGEERLAICEQIERTPFVLIRIIATEETLGRLKPWQLLLGMSCLAVLIMVGAVISVKVFLNSRILGVRLAEAETREKAISEKNVQLELEVQERRRAQESFNMLHMAMEDVPLNSILGMALNGLGGIPWLEVLDKSSILLIEEGSGRLRMAACKGYGPSARPCCEGCIPGECLCGMAAAKKIPLFRRSDEPSHPGKCPIEEPHAHYCMPMLYGQKIVGVLNLILSQRDKPAKNAEQFIEAFAGALSFIVQRRRADEELRQAHESNKTLINSIPLALITLDSARRVIRFNPSAEKLLGKKLEELVGRDIGSCGIGWDFSPLAKAIEELKDGIAPAPFEARFSKPDGSEGFLNVSVSPISGAGPDLAARILIVAGDATERKSMEAQLLLTQKLEAIGELAAGIAHEINTPIQYIGSNLEFLSSSFKELLDYVKEVEAASKEVSGPALAERLQSSAKAHDVEFIIDDAPHALRESIDGAAHVAEIVRALKEFSHPSQERTNLDLNKALSNTITVTQNEWKYVAEVRTDFDRELPPVLCVPGEISQVFLNIIINAAQAISEVVGKSGAKGLILISTKTDGAMAEVRISDSGPGIPDSIKPRVFDPFFTTKEVGKGTGQGLPIARNVIVKKHGGELFFESAQGKGTVFVIRLPVSK